MVKRRYIPPNIYHGNKHGREQSPSYLKWEARKKERAALERIPSNPIVQSLDTIPNHETRTVSYECLYRVYVQEDLDLVMVRLMASKDNNFYDHLGRHSKEAPDDLYTFEGIHRLPENIQERLAVLSIMDSTSRPTRETFVDHVGARLHEKVFWVVLPEILTPFSAGQTTDIAEWATRTS